MTSQFMEQREHKLLTEFTLDILGNKMSRVQFDQQLTPLTSFVRKLRTHLDHER